MIRKCLDKDIDSVFILEQENFKDPWSRKLLEDEILNATYAHYFVYEVDNHIIGYFGISIILDECEIHSIVVDNKFQSQGIGKKMLRFIIEYCKSLNVEKIVLEVREFNLHAIRLYESFGFKKIKRIESYYKNPTEDAFLMVLDLNTNIKDINVLAIETSCDETSVAILKNGKKIRSNIISSQINTHKKFGGVVPEVASRLHLEAMNNILKEALEQANMTFESIDLIAVTKGPGLIGALLVGASCAKALAYTLKKPLIGVNHMQGHICANYITHNDLKPPFISLVISGGHTCLIEVEDYVHYHVLGKTRDDAVGESFDKVARSLGLSYPGGPEIEKIAKSGNANAINFPRVMLEKDSYDFSFSGLKTNVLNYLNSKKQKEEKIIIEDVAASFQQAVFDVLVEKTFRLLHEKNEKKLVVSGGVSANETLKNIIIHRANQEGIKVYFPDKILCTDNAAMIATAGYYDYVFGKEDDFNMKVYPNLEL